jgi:signal peptidase I
VSKYPYGWSWVSPSFHIAPPMEGRLFGSLPERGDIVIVTPPGQSADYIKRAVGMPGDEIEMIEGQLYINGTAVKRQAMAHSMIPVDENAPCSPMEFPGARVTGPDGKLFCRLPIIRETLPNGVSYDTIDLGYFPVDDFAKIKVPANHVFLMGDNRDKSADSRVSLQDQGLGGPVPYENIGGRAEFITFSLNGTSEYFNPISWFTALRGGRAGDSLHPQRAAGK